MSDSRKRAARAKGRRGYTIIEVMMAMGVLALGASGIVAMQKVTLSGNQNARMVGAATTVAQTWMDRLRADAGLWNMPAIQFGQSDLAETRYLAALANSNVGTGWFIPGNGVGNMTAYADQTGTDVANGDPNPVDFCTQIRLTPIAFTNNLATLIRAEVRVFWAKGTSKGVGGVGKPMTVVECNGLQGTEVGYGSVYVASGIAPTYIPN